jgi:4-hydroxy-tetrahydrodipicolinate synthase
MVQAISNNDLPGARRLHLELFELCRGLLTMATNPIPIKAAMALAGHDTGELRLPMTPLPSADRDALRKLLLDLEVELA